MIFARPATEATRKKYIELIANAYAGGNPRLAGQFMAQGRRLGLTLDEMDIRQAKGMASRLKGVQQPILGE
jgi:hypothetical protein